MAELVTESRYHRTINGAELALCRVQKGLTQEQLATEVAKHLDRVGLSQQFIARIEGPGETMDWQHEVPADIALAIFHVLK